jgi:hypothetical protein
MHTGARVVLTATPCLTFSVTHHNSGLPETMTWAQSQLSFSSSICPSRTPLIESSQIAAYQDTQIWL